MGNSDKKQVMLLGDSLRMGYQPVVSRILDGKAVVSGPEENGRWAGYTLNSLRFWIDDMPKPDIVHWNCGLWDLGDDYELGRPFSLPEEYESSVERTVIVINKLFPDAKLILATTMPTYYHSAESVSAYNDIIRKVADKYNLPVNNLFPIVNENMSLIGEDKMHLTDEGYEIVGEKVAKAVSEFF